MVHPPQPEPRLDGRLVIAMDGPGASGKNTVGLLVARRLGYRFIDTGAMYRALTWAALDRGLDFDDTDALANLARGTRLEVLPGTREAPEDRMLVDGRDVTGLLHLPEVDAKVSLLSRVPEVREVLVGVQRSLARRGGVVLAGRDIGTVVLPDADLKIYLDATPEERARRRFEEMRAEGIDIRYDQVLQELRRRDGLDQGRAVAPLRPAADACILLTDGRSPEELADAIASAARSGTRPAGCKGPES